MGPSAAENKNILVMIWKNIEETAKSISHTTKQHAGKRKQRNSEKMLHCEKQQRRDAPDPLNVKFQDESHAGQGRACCQVQFAAWQKNTKKRRPLTELYVNDREKELRRHCDEVHVGLEETIEEQEKRIMKCKGGDRHFTEKGRVAEITF